MIRSDEDGPAIDEAVVWQAEFIQGRLYDAIESPWGTTMYFCYLGGSEMRMVIRDLSLGGAVPVETEVRREMGKLVIKWLDSEFVLDADEIRNVLEEDDLK